jgi:hypothetical protein
MPPKDKIRGSLAFTLVLLSAAGFLAGLRGTVLAKPLTFPLHGYGVYAGSALSNSLKFFFGKKRSSFLPFSSHFWGKKFTVKESEKPQSVRIAVNSFCGAKGRICQIFN